MTTVADIQTKLTALTTAVDAERAEVLAVLKSLGDDIAALKAQVAAGGVASQADLDNIGSALDAATTKIQAIIDGTDVPPL